VRPGRCPPQSIPSLGTGAHRIDFIRPGRGAMPRAGDTCQRNASADDAITEDTRRDGGIVMIHMWLLTSPSELCARGVSAAQPTRAEGPACIVRIAWNFILIRLEVPLGVARDQSEPRLRFWAWRMPETDGTPEPRLNSSRADSLSSASSPAYRLRDDPGGLRRAA
jgi:hypothetical protein